MLFWFLQDLAYVEQPILIVARNNYTIPLLVYKTSAWIGCSSKWAQKMFFIKVLCLFILSSSGKIEGISKSHNKSQWLIKLKIRALVAHVFPLLSRECLPQSQTCFLWEIVVDESEFQPVSSSEVVGASNRHFPWHIRWQITSCFPAVLAVPWHYEHNSSFSPLPDPKQQNFLM